MRSILSLVLLLALAQCGPRDDEKLMGQGGRRDDGFNLAANEVLKVTSEGQKLDSCNKPDQPTWNTVRLYKETSYLFEKAGQLKVVVGRGSFNCAPVSTKNAIQIEVQEESWRKTGDYYFVTRLEMYNTEYFLSLNDLVRQTAEGMAMTEQQLRDFLSQGEPRPQVTLTYLEPAEGGTTPDPQPATVPEIRFPENEGEMLSECGSGWPGVRLQGFVLEKAQSLIDNKSLRALLNPTDRNCLPMGAIINIEVNQDGSWSPLENVKVRVVGAIVFDKNDLVSFPFLAEKVAEEIGLSQEEFLEFMQQLTSDQVNLTRIEWVEN